MFLKTFAMESNIFFLEKKNAESAFFLKNINIWPLLEKWYISNILHAPTTPHTCKNMVKSGWFQKLRRQRVPTIF